ncbi:hypothetical protein [Clostridium estertheticum]|uniref:hypothetical protein n=1 Tax=Clostridium estertheticum TaxID=238834 RepID=UPI001C6DE41A|nr:hypothetical protein [Clostridium estertheticum]MBW9170959.1 hypothetical protein [Clostridium estertheticum]MBX4268642.1 hypothetical protein [Clostridium estertheticum]WLC74173.1 hypothetical protein KTC99_15520 [Clostridium estertheticum]WLC79153.1 hypothetical protein KTC98_18500 [Clostridium estertheticum]
MLKILFSMNILIITIALFLWIIGMRSFKRDGYSKKSIKYILQGTIITGICLIIGSILLVPIFFAA